MVSLLPDTGPEGSARKVRKLRHEGKMSCWGRKVNLHLILPSGGLPIVRMQTCSGYLSRPSRFFSRS